MYPSVLSHILVINPFGQVFLSEAILVLVFLLLGAPGKTDGHSDGGVP